MPPLSVASALTHVSACLVASAGNVVQSAEGVSVTASLQVSQRPDPRADNLGGATVVAVVGGSAAFESLAVRAVGANYSLLFTSTPRLEPAVSLPEFEVVHGAFDHLHMLRQPYGASEVGMRW